MSTLLAIVAPPLLLVPAMGLLSAIASSSELARELKRKVLHVAVGLAALSLPALMSERWMIAVALGLVLAWMGTVRVVAPLKRRFGACLFDARDPERSRGEMYFALGVAFLLFAAADHGPLYVIPLLILTFADAAAAIVGQTSPAGRAKLAGKTLTGSLAFFAVAGSSTLCALLAATPLLAIEAVPIAALVAATTCTAEAVCRRGLDNVAIPLVAYLTLLPFEITRTA